MTHLFFRMLAFGFIFIFLACSHSPKPADSQTSVSRSREELFIARSTRVTDFDLYKKGRDEKTGHIIFAKTTDVMPKTDDPREDSFRKMYYHWPSVMISLGGAWSIHEFKDLKAHDWMGTYFDENLGHIWGFLEQHTGDSGEGLTVVFSSDWGRNWKQIGYVEKPHYMAAFKSFHISPQGKGYAVFALEAEYQKKPHPRSTTAYYRSATADRGKTWKLEGKAFLVDTLSAPDSRDSGHCTPSLEPVKDKTADRACVISFIQRD